MICAGPIAARHLEGLGGPFRFVSALAAGQNGVIHSLWGARWMKRPTN
jgi:hypothetical protein